MFVFMCVCACVCVSVLDVNDETPTFSPRLYNVSLLENIPRDYVVARLICTDNDTGLNAELSYFITGQRSRWLGVCVCVGYRVQIPSWEGQVHSVSVCGFYVVDVSAALFSGRSALPQRKVF